MELSDIRADISPEDLSQLMNSNPVLLNQLQHVDPELAEAVRKGVSTLRLLMMRRFMSKHKLIHDKREEMKKIEANPDSAEHQARIAEEIRRANVMDNRNLAMEEMPEAFGRVYMLYIKVEVNGVPVKAFVDSGAQSTIMSVRCAERCNLLRLLDTDYAGEARGVGTAKILGRVHIAQMKLGGSFFPMPITVLEKNDVDFLFGLDMLKRHRCVIDLTMDALRVEGASGTESIPFLGENEIDQGGMFSDALKAAESHSDQSAAGVPAPISTDLSEKISHLVGLGFSETVAAQALAACGGDLDLAASILFQSNGSS